VTPDIDAILRQKTLDLLAARKPDSSICPSDVPRALFPDWRSYMGDIRRVALRMALDGTIMITQRGVPVDLDRFGRGEIMGPIRLRMVRSILAIHPDAI
jgi:Protein of unknown function (DUF3253)